MTKTYLHRYPASPFSEKIRTLLGYLALEWHSVETSVTMPRPLPMPLSGGYRRVPVAQTSAGVYCDTKITARALAAQAGECWARGRSLGKDRNRCDWRRP